jgi:hypothetical protein
MESPVSTRSTSSQIRSRSDYIIKPHNPPRSRYRIHTAVYYYYYRTFSVLTTALNHALISALDPRSTATIVNGFANDKPRAIPEARREGATL